MLIIHTSHISRSEMIHHINSSEIDLGRRPKESCSFAVSWIIVQQWSASPLHPTHNLGERAVARHGSWCGEAAVQSFLTILAFGGSAAVARMQVCRTAPRCVALRRGPLGPFLRSVQWRSLHLTCCLPACRCPTNSHLPERNLLLQPVTSSACGHCDASTASATQVSRAPCPAVHAPHQAPPPCPSLTDHSSRALRS